ncbi:hypothetical protein Cni_G08717 [Canna indica]|uniref:Homeobox domain-containing protein n=1 Tax=Canna indica TaxID=4628 RepID=A0AAQ3Q5Z2_9LILI|nr:hypothetical protein Cni_G08717 [Canna indica]
MAHESHYGQFLLGVNPLIQGLDNRNDFLGIDMLEAPSKQQINITSHFPKNFFHHDLPESSNKNLLPSTEMEATTWPVDDPSPTSSLFDCQWSKQMNGNLSLSLLNAKPEVGVSGFMDQRQLKTAYHQQQQLVAPEQLFQLKNSMYLKPVQELLRECCSIGGLISSERPRRTSQWEEREASSSWNPSLFSKNHLELHKLKMKLYSMIEEVERRYRKYCEQMRVIVSFFDSVAGEGAADVYCTLASKAMSRHFRLLKDSIVGQVKSVKKAMGEKDDSPIAPGIRRGETPRLKLLDQCVRQHKALQQGLAQQLPWRPQRGLPERSVSILRAWLFEHFLHPYPNDVDKIILARQAGLSRSQVSNWFINARVRIWKPMVEEMYAEETKELDDDHSNQHQYINSNPNPNPTEGLDQKPMPVQLNVSESLSSIINSSQHGGESVGGVDFDFSTYSSLAGDSLRRSSVSLTLGLQQHSRGGMSLSLTPASQHSILFPKEHINRGEQVGFSIFAGERQAFSLKNLMGTQLLHDFSQ